MTDLDAQQPGASTDYRWLPKVELHCHIEGTMRANTIADLAKQNGVPLPVDDVQDMFAYEDLTGFLDVFWLVQSVLQTPDDWERLAYESILDAAQHGVVHREAFFTPGRHLNEGQDLGDIIAALDRGCASAETETGTTSRLILEIDREFGGEVATDHVATLVELITAQRAGTDRVIGLGMDSTELGIDPLDFADAYALAPEAGLRRTAHQGENSPAEAIAAAVDGLGCERIDHGISIFEDPELVKRFADTQTPLTVCPSANVRINPGVVAELGDHVFPAMREAGLLATLDTDDPALVGLDLADEYSRCAATFGYDTDDMVQTALDSIRASWLDDSERSALALRVHAAASSRASLLPSG